MTSHPLRRRVTPVTLGIGLFAAAATSPTTARAGSMDPALSRLVLDPGCLAPGSTEPCLPDRAAYRKLVSQWGFALSPAAPHEARTTGLGGVDVSLQAAFTSVDQDSDYLRRGTRGDAATASDGVVVENESPDSIIPLYSLVVRKGFGLGLEGAASLGVTPSSSLIAWGGDLRFVPFEGLLGGPYAYVPDLSAGVSLREISGMHDVDLSIWALDARASRPFVVGESQRVTPWLGYQWVNVRSRSAPVDLTPAVDPLIDCGYLGGNVPSFGLEEAQPVSGAPPGVYDGALRCLEPSRGDVRNTVSFGDLSVVRHRVLLGVGYRREWLDLGLQVVTDLLSPGAAQSSESGRRELECDADGEDCRAAPRQWTLSVEVGARL